MCCPQPASSYNALIGVLVGAGVSLIVPTINHFRDKHKEKKKLRPQLRQTLYLLSRYKRLTIEAFNKERWHSLQANYLHNILRLPTTGGTHRAEIERQLKVTNDYIDSIGKQSNDSFANVLKYQAEIISILAQIQNYYSNSLYETLYNMLAPYIDEAIIINLLDYDMLFANNQTLDIQILRDAIAIALVNQANTYNTLTTEINKIL